MNPAFWGGNHSKKGGDAGIASSLPSLDSAAQRRRLGGGHGVGISNRERGQKRERGDSLISGDDVRQLTEILAGKARPEPEDDPAA